MNTYFRFEQPWFLLLAAFFLCSGSSAGASKDHRLFGSPPRAFSREQPLFGTPGRRAFQNALYYFGCVMFDRRPCPATIWHRHQPGSGERHRYHDFTRCLAVDVIGRFLDRNPASEPA